MGRRILLIEDDARLLKNLSDFLKEEGFTVRGETEGNAGIEAAVSWKPDLIICDIALPGKDGYQILKEVTEKEATQITPFIFLTARVNKEDLRKGMTLGADDYIFKPFDLDDLSKSIRLRFRKRELMKSRNPEANQNEKKNLEIDDKLLISNGNKMQFAEIKELKFLKAESPYVRLKFRNGKNVLLRESLNIWESKLPSKNFIRIHRSAIINTEFIAKIEKLGKSSYLLRLTDEDESFIISKRYSSKLKNRFS